MAYEALDFYDIDSMLSEERDGQRHGEGLGRR